VTLFCMALPSAFSQVQQRTIEELQRLEREKATVEPKGDVLDKNDTDTAHRKADEVRRKIESMPDTGITVTLSKVEFSKSDIFSEQELQGFADSVLNKMVGMADLHRMTGAINAEYAKRGYPLNIANLPPQKLADGKLQVQLLEARLGEIKVENNKGLSEAYVLNHLRLTPGTPIRVETLEDSLVHFNKTNRAAVVSELRAGAEIGTTDLITRVEEPPRLELMAYGDNAGRRNTGLYRGTAMVRGYSWLGSGDTTTLAGVFSEGTKTAFGAYEVPVGGYGISLGGSYAYGETEVISGPFEPLDITGESHTGDVYSTVPLYTSNDFVLKAVVHGTYYHSTTDFVNVLTDKEETYGGTLGLVGELRDAWGSWSFYGDFRGGHASLGASSAVPDPREGEFYKFNGQISRYLRFNDMFYVVGAVGGQAAFNRRLASSEQFQLGGVATVRGYPEGVLLGDHGYFVRAEGCMNLPRSDADNLWGFVSRTISFFTFVDHGGSFPYKGHDLSQNDSDFLTSCGVGIMFNWRDMLTAQFTYAKPLQDVPFGQKEENYLFRVGCHFSW
jgi:hemolysin activation/secretion protein